MGEGLGCVARCDVTVDFRITQRQPPFKLRYSDNRLGDLLLD